MKKIRIPNVGPFTHALHITPNVHYEPKIAPHVFSGVKSYKNLRVHVWLISQKHTKKSDVLEFSYSRVKCWT